MTKKEALEIISREALVDYNFFEQRPNRKEEVGIPFTNGKCLVYTTDERSYIDIGAQKVFDREEDALKSFIHRLRADKILKETGYKGTF